METRLKSQEAFAYMQRRLADENLEFSYDTRKCTTNKFIKGISGRVKLNDTDSNVSVHLDFERFKYDSNLPIFGISFNNYFPSIKESGFEGNLEILAKILNVRPKEIIASNHIQKIIDDGRYRKMEDLRFLREDVNGSYKDFSKKFELEFKVEGKDFDDTYFATKDLDLIVSLFVK